MEARTSYLGGRANTGLIRLFLGHLRMDSEAESTRLGRAEWDWQRPSQVLVEAELVDAAVSDLPSKIDLDALPRWMTAGQEQGPPNELEFEAGRGPATDWDSPDLDWHAPVGEWCSLGAVSRGFRQARTRKRRFLLRATGDYLEANSSTPLQILSPRVSLGSHTKTASKCRSGSGSWVGFARGLRGRFGIGSEEIGSEEIGWIGRGLLGRACKYSG